MAASWLHRAGLSSAQSSSRTTAAELAPQSKSDQDGRKAARHAFRQQESRQSSTNPDILPTGREEF
jgi:hypothetical protein